MKQLVPVVFATDDNFAPCCSVAIASLIANRDPERSYAIHVLYDDLSQEHRDRLGSMAAENVTVECVSIKPFVDEKALYITKRYTRAIYFRFYAADALPQYDKLVYLDSDLVLFGDVGELFDTDMEGNWLCGVVNYKSTGDEKRSKEEYLAGTLGITPEEYINSGVLLMNLKAFRQEKLGQRCVQFLQEHTELRWMDQDALNAVCKGRIGYLDIVWNKNQYYYEDEREDGLDVSGTKLLHYLNRDKPWLVDFRAAHIPFYQYAILTPYAAELREVFLDNNRENTTHRNHACRREEEAAEKLAQKRAAAKAEAEERAAQRRAEQAAAAEARKIAQHAAIEKKAAALAKRLLATGAKDQVLEMASKGQAGPRFLLKCGWRWLKARCSGAHRS